MNDNSRNNNNEAPGNNRTADIVIALSVGLLAGVAGTLLLAPASGRNTRLRISGLAGQAADTANRMVHRAGEVIKDQAGRLDHAFAEGKQAYRQGSDHMPS